MTYKHRPLDKKLKEAPEVLVWKTPITSYLATSSEEEELIRKAREIGPKEIKNRIENSVFKNEVVAEVIDIRYPTEVVYGQNLITRKTTHRAFSGSGRLLDYVPLFIIAHEVTDNESIEVVGTSIAGSVGTITTKKEAVTVTHNEIDGRKCALLYTEKDNIRYQTTPRFTSDKEKIHRKLLEICVEQNNGEEPHLYAREVINDLKGGRKTISSYSTRGSKEGEMHYLDLNLASRPENIKAISQSLENIVEMMKEGKSPFLDKEVNTAILGLISSIDNISKRSKDGVPLTEEFHKNLKTNLPHYLKDLLEQK